MATDDRPREPSGRLQRPSKAKIKRIPQSELDAGIYPAGDMRNEPAIAEWIRDRRPVDLPTDLNAVHFNPPKCAQCGQLLRR